MKIVLQLVISSLLISGNFAQRNPLKDPNTCGLPGCKGSGKFMYGPGSLQNYKYLVEVRTLFNGTSKNESTLYVEGVVTLSFLTHCDGILTLSDVRLSENIPKGDYKDTEHTDSEQFANAISEYSLRFSFKDGIISELCPSDGEESWVINFKRGILSMLHNSMKRFDLDHSTYEEDVRGNCPTNYRVLRADGTSLLIEKSKDLNGCQRRSKFHSAIQSTTLNLDANYRNEKILNYSSHCQLSIDHNIYNNITCEEIYILQPFSNKGAGVTTIINQKLNLLNEEKVGEVSDEREITQRTVLSFDHTQPRKITRGDLKTSRDLMKMLCKRNRNDHLDLSDLFSKFIQSLRLLSYPATSALYRHSKTICPTARKHLLDTLPFVNTVASVTLMRDIILRERLPETTVNEWVFTLAFISNPNENIMEVALDILQKTKFSPNSILSIASLTHSYCIHHSDCGNNNKVYSIVSYLENHFLKLSKMNYLDREVYDKAMVTLKALSNIGVLSDDFQNEILKVIEDRNVDVGIRVAAVEVFRRFPCEKIRSYFENVFRNQTEDAEIRIASYLQLMRCPNYLLIRIIRHSLLHEEVNQVGSFIWSHLNNLLKSSIPSKVEIQSLLSEKDLVKKFSSDIRKYSHNFEGSLYFDDYNLGGNYESNVIFSTSSYIPRTAAFNFTVDIFGESVNLFEIYGRLEGFEQYLESFFGPKGSAKKEGDNIIKSVRKVRNVRGDETLKNQVSRLPNVVDGIAIEPKTFLGLKIFGNEIAYRSFRGHDEIWNAIQTLNPVYNLKRILSGKEITYDKSVMFLDCNYVVPTSAGFPLLLNALGTSSIIIKLYGSLKTVEFSKDKDLELNLTADIQPTISLDVTGEMSVDAFYASTGAKIKTNMYTDSAVKAIVRIKGSKLVSLKFSLPRQTNEIFAARSELLIKRNNNEERQRGLSSKADLKSICSSPSVEETIGLNICTQYYYVNSTSMENVPEFLLAGPSGFRWYIQKSDPTANTYLFEYKWTHRKDLSIVSLIFDTPGAQIKRLLNANITIDKQSQNLTMLLQSSVGTVLARGKYKNTEDEKFIQIALDINNKKHFDASMSLVRSIIKNGYSYRPKLYIGVNGERVLMLDGSIDSMSKKGISQYTIDLKFETKRLYSKLFGYVSKSESSIDVNLYQDYKFHQTREQRIVLKFGVANRSRKNMIVVVGFCNLNSTAYPTLNFASNATFQRSGGHMDLVVKLAQNPLTSDHPEADFHTLYFDALFSYKSFTDNRRVLKIVTAVSRKVSNLDLKGEFVCESINHDINIATLIKYGINKEVIITIFWSHPRSTLEQIKTHINITIPSFSPMILKMDIQEKQPKDYMIDIKATWFSGHSLVAVGIYQDKSTPSSSNHHIKLFLNSPSFKDTDTDLTYYRDNNILKLDFKVLNGDDDYQLLLHHQLLSFEETNTQAKLKYKEKLYRFIGTVYNGNYRKIHAELHIDQIRDIDSSVWIYNEEANKAFGFELNWDANRNPDQKLLVSANYTKLADFNYAANFIFSYPSRTVIGEYRLLLNRNKINTLASVSWNDGNTFAIDLNVLYGNEEKLFLDISSHLRTPFKNWKLTKVDGVFERLNNKYNFNGMITWEQGQKVAVDIFGDYTGHGSYFTCKYSCAVASTLNHIPNINATISHNQNDTNFNSILHLMYNPDFTIGLNSQWIIESHKGSMDLTGTVHTYTPFTGFKKGLLESKIFLVNSNSIKGVAEVDLDHKKMVVNLEGQFKRITNCSLTINITTPVEDYQLRFRISREDRHFVALLTYPTGNLGTELLFSVNSLTNFDVKFILATPIEFLQMIAVIGKLQPAEADFRVAWNSLLVGFSGVWNYVNITYFEYSYKIYTPLNDFEENGIVAKIKLMEGLDTEWSIKLSKYKLGFKLLGQTKSKPLEELVKLRNTYLRSKIYKLEEKEEDDSFSWKGLIEVDIIIYSTMKGVLEIDRKANSYIVKSQLTMPHGVASLYDELEYIDIFRIKNSLQITTPYQNFKTILSNFDFIVETGHTYIFGLNIDYQNQTRLVKTGIYVKYLAELRKTTDRKYNIILKINTPFKEFPELNLLGTFEIEPNSYYTELLFKTNRSNIALDGNMKINGSLLELWSNFNIMTPIINVPPCELKLIKFFSATNNYLEININMPEKLQRDIYFKSTWLIKSRRQFRSLLQLETPFTGLENTTTSLDVYISKELSSMSALIQMNPIDMETVAKLQNNTFTATSSLKFEGKNFPLTVNCTILQPSQDTREFDGYLMLREKLFKISGNADVIGGLPTRVSLKLSPEDNTSPLNFKYQLRSISLNKYKLDGSIQHSTKCISFNAYLNTTDKLNWDFLLEVSPDNTTRIDVYTNLSSNETTNILNINAHTPIPDLKEPKLGATYSVLGEQHKFQGFFEVTKARGSVDIYFVWKLLENMYIGLVGNFQNINYSSRSTLEAFYENINKEFKFLKTGGDINFGGIWKAGSNITLQLYDDIKFEGHLKLPDNNTEIHTIYGKVNYTKNIRNIDYSVKYRTIRSLKKYGSWGLISTEDKTNLAADIEVELDNQRYHNVGNLKILANNSFDCLYNLQIPKLPNKRFIVAKLSLKPLKDHYNISCKIFSPEDRSIASASVHYKELDNMNGTFNITIPYKSINYTGAYFDTKTTPTIYNRYIKAFWDGNNAVVDSKCSIQTNSQDKTIKGILELELPLTTRHIANVDYEYNKKDEVSIGHATVIYNGSNVLESTYNRVTEKGDKLTNDKIHLELKNKFIPVGADYIHKQEYEAPKAKDNLPNIDHKYIHLFNLYNQTKFNLTGEVYVRTKWSGQEYSLKATHGNRTIRLWNDYDLMDREYNQKSRLELSPSNWIQFDINLLNKTTDATFDAQQLLVNVFYPRRNFTAEGSYNISDSTVATNLSLFWDNNNKTVQVGVDWRRAAIHREELLLQIKHPSFERDVSIFTEYGYNTSSMDGKVSVKYSLDPNQKLTFGGKLTDNINRNTYNYSYNIYAEHNNTNLNLNSRGDFYWNPSVFGTEHVAHYQRSYLPESTSEALAKVNLHQNEIELKKDNIATGLSYFYGKYGGEFPVYTANISAAHGINDTSGEFYVNLIKKLLYFNMNMTEDGSQSLHVYGCIPDARNAIFDIWRNYDDKRVSDVSYFLRLNHSRLIMSKLSWRPEVIGDVQSGIRSSIMNVYSDFLDNINNTKQYVRTEILDAVHGIWIDAKPYVDVFLSDLRNLTVIEDDLMELKLFLNKSYHANEFYIKDITTVAMTMFDELALKSHLQSLPAIIQEIWSVMGESGQKIKKGILWVIEKVQLYYKNTTEFVHELINGDPVEHISKLIEKLVERYDNFIKNVHVSVIQYMEKLWMQIYTLIVENWHKTLAAIEPTFLKFVHYLESIVYSTGKEFLDFLYLRKYEIIESPYFAKFTKFSHDIDRFYKDITGKNTIASIYKYLTITWNFLKEKYINTIPFGKELSAIVNEILTELKQVGNLPSIRYLIDKSHEAYEYAKYYYNYFDCENRIHKIFTMIYIKLSDMSVTALEAENRQRVAKTKFVFEPNDGIMLLEQKLPMPWHAFNETPKFKEISEIKAIYDLHSYLELSKISFWNLYYDYKPLLNPSEWLPPFKGQAMLLGSKYYITFDRKYYNFQGSCTYLLSTDFIDHNFTLLADYNKAGNTNELILLLNKTIVRINIFNKNIQVEGIGMDRLPLQIEDNYLYQVADILVVHSASGFMLECNMKFHICIFEMSGWYFGKTAGLWGTYNNEPSDDFLSSSKIHMNTSQVGNFADSWILDKQCRTKVATIKKLEKIPENILTLCEDFFTSKVSQLNTCFERVPKESFLAMCLNSTTEEDACMSAVSYINLCSYINVPLRIPDTCVKCKIPNGTEIKEGDIIRLQGSTIPQTVDVVFIIEAKRCNRDLKKNKNFEMVVELLDKEFTELNMTENRYAVVIFGGDGVYDEPRSVIMNGNTFTDSKSVVNYFNNLPIGNGNKDIFSAIIFAYNLILRPGASRTFIVVPCSECNKYNMDYDYSTIHQLLSEGAVSLHILMNEYFTTQKEREVKSTFGIDKSYAYSKKDMRTLTGDQLLRKAITLPKSSLGHCLSLTMETHGAIFTGKYLEVDKKNAKKFCVVFAKVVAHKSLPPQCMDCECTAPNSGVSYMECYQCTVTNLTRNPIEHHILGFEDEETFNMNVFEGL